MANKLKLIPKAQRGSVVIPNGREVLPQGLTIEQYLNAKKLVNETLWSI